MQPEKRRLKAKWKRKTANRIKASLQKRTPKGTRVPSGFLTDDWSKIKEASKRRVIKREAIAKKKAEERKIEREKERRKNEPKKI